MARAATPNLSAIEGCLRRAGYDERWLKRKLALPTGRIASLVAFCGKPFDARTACISVIAGTGSTDHRDLVAELRPIVAPLSVVANTDQYEIWKQGGERPALLNVLGAAELDNYFDRHKSALAPNAIYRAKVWGRLEDRQLDFIDAGLLSVMEDEAGKRITALIVEAVEEVQAALGWREPTPEQGQAVLQSVFWLLAAKILHDKRVERFRRLELEDLDTVFERVAQHYQSSVRPTRPRGKEWRAALTQAARRIRNFASLELLSTESLGYLYESALIDRATRQRLGTHSTPAWLVDYVIGKLRPWIEEMPVAERRIFEPACGHAAFLIGGLRLLSELRPSSHSEERRPYLRKRLRGVEIDPFAIEIARLSLTLADVPNPNGWALVNADMFEGDLLAAEAQAATIVLSNPPFEDNQASETLRRVVDHLPPGGVLGFVVPHNFLVAKSDSALRKKLLSSFEIAEISVFADKVFRCGSPEAAIVIARHRRPANMATLHYQRVREAHVAAFRETYRASTSEPVGQEKLRSLAGAPLFVPELHDIWDSLDGLPRLVQHAEVGQGFTHKSANSAPRGVILESRERRRGLVSGFTGWAKQVMIHECPQETWVNISNEVIDRPRSGTEVGRPQVIMNYAPISRGPWCVTAMIDAAGHAVNSRYLVIRPSAQEPYSLLVLWAVLNSPIGNAYLHTHSSKRDITVGTLRGFPLPRISREGSAALETAVRAYMAAAQEFSGDEPQGNLFSKRGSSRFTEEQLKYLLWEVDAQVLQLYALLPEAEQRVLHLFAGMERRGVPFEQMEYLPTGFDLIPRLSELIAVLRDWDEVSTRKEILVDRKLDGEASAQDLCELAELQRLTIARRELLAPLPLEALEEIQRNLERRGLWREP